MNIFGIRVVLAPPHVGPYFGSVHDQKRYQTHDITPLP